MKTEVVVVTIKRTTSDDTLCPPRPGINAAPNPHQSGPQGEDIKEPPPQPAFLNLLCKRQKFEGEGRVLHRFSRVEKVRENGPEQPVSMTHNDPAEVLSVNLISGRYYGPRNKLCRCRPAKYHNSCRTTQRGIARRKWLVPREPLIVRNETCRYLLEDGLGTVHASELQPIDALADETSAKVPFDQNEEATGRRGDFGVIFALPPSHQS